VATWTIEEHETATGKSHLAEFVAGLSDRVDVKDTAVLIGALRALGNQLREPRSKALVTGFLNCVERECESTTDSFPNIESACWADTLRSARTRRSRYFT
jgi:hypothetical protein